MNRPQSSHRLSVNSTPSSNMHATSRHHSHSVSLGAVNPSHRITRRKSMNTTAVNNVAAIAAALNDMGDKGSASSKRGSLNLKTAASSRPLESSNYSNSSGGRYPLVGFAGNNGKSNEEAMDDEESVLEDDCVPTENVSTGSKVRARRASEGSYLSKSEGKRSSGELRCDNCGKGYKHSSCLAKHRSVISGLPVIQLFAFTSPRCTCVSLSVNNFGIESTLLPQSSCVDIWCLQMGTYS